jgi:hypothetical protein
MKWQYVTHNVSFPHCQKFKEGINIQTARISGRKYDKIIEIMPKDNSEVIDLNSLEAVQEMEEREEVESVEKGKSLDYPLQLGLRTQHVNSRNIN